MSSKKHVKKSKLVSGFFKIKLNRDVVFILTLSIAIFTFVLDRFLPQSGFLGALVYEFLVFCFGDQFFYLIWVYSAFSAFVLLLHRSSLRILMPIMLLSMMLQFLLIELSFQPFLLSFKEHLARSQTGFFGASFYFLSTWLLGRLGTYILIFSLQITCVFFVFHLSFKPLLKRFFEFLNYLSRMGIKSFWPLLKRSLFYRKKSRKILMLSKKKRAALPLDVSSTDVANDIKESVPEFNEKSFFSSGFESDEPLHSKEDTFKREKDTEVDHQPALDSTFVEATTSKSLSSQVFVLPPVSLLKKSKRAQGDRRQLDKSHRLQAKVLEEALLSFNVKAKVVHITSGPSVTRFELEPGEGVKISRITALAKDIALKLAVADVRIEAPIPGKALVGIEVPNASVDMVTLRRIMEEKRFMANPEKLLTGIGFTITGEAIEMDLAKMPHVLIAGATGSGKSVCINAIIISILMRAKPDEVKFLMIDPKKVELSLYEGIPHLLSPVVTDAQKAAATLKKWALLEMERRYDAFSKAGVKDLKGYNAWVETQQNKEGEEAVVKIPYIVVVIDELADLMMVASQDVEQTICRLAQMSRATGIHLVIATQRPSVNVITGLIKANVPSRVSFFLQSQIDSRTILDMAGAEKLLGKGDMLYSPVGALKATRAQGVFVSEDEVKGIVSWLKRQGSPDYVNELLTVEPIGQSQDEKKESSSQDALYEDAKQLIISTRYASTSYLQRKLKIGYNRAARIMDELEENGVIAEYVGERKSTRPTSMQQN